MMHFGATENDTTPIRKEQFSFGVRRADGVETHTFTALLGKLDAGGLIAALIAVENDDGGKAATAYYRTIAKLVDNSDGIPARWEPKALRQEEGDERPQMFRVPWGRDKGQLMKLDDASSYLEGEVHSSRRRWLHLMEQDDDAIVEFEDLSKIFEWLVKQSSGNHSAVSS